MDRIREGNQHGRNWRHWMLVAVVLGSLAISAAVLTFAAIGINEYAKGHFKHSDAGHEDYHSVLRRSAPAILSNSSETISADTFVNATSVPVVPSGISSSISDMAAFLNANATETMVTATVTITNTESVRATADVEISGTESDGTFISTVHMNKTVTERPIPTLTPFANVTEVASITASAFTNAKISGAGVVAASEILHTWPSASSVNKTITISTTRTRTSTHLVVLTGSPQSPGATSISSSSRQVASSSALVSVNTPTTVESTTKSGIHADSKPSSMPGCSSEDHTVTVYRTVTGTVVSKATMAKTTESTTVNSTTIGSLASNVPGVTVGIDTWNISRPAVDGSSVSGSQKTPVRTVTRTTSTTTTAPAFVLTPTSISKLDQGFSSDTVSSTSSMDTPNNPTMSTPCDDGYDVTTTLTTRDTVVEISTVTKTSTPSQATTSVTFVTVTNGKATVTKIELFTKNVVITRSTTSKTTVTSKAIMTPRADSNTTMAMSGTGGVTVVADSFLPPYLRGSHDGPDSANNGTHPTSPHATMPQSPTYVVSEGTKTTNPGGRGTSTYGNCIVMVVAIAMLMF